MATNKKSLYSLSEKAAITACLVNAFLTMAKFFMAMITTSLTLTAEALHSLSDVATSIAVLIAVHLGDVKPESDKKGLKYHLRANLQTIIALLIGVFLLWISVTVFMQVFSPVVMDLIHPIPCGIAVLFLALISFLLSRLEAKVGKKENSTALIADSHHSKVDMLVSLLVGLILIGEGLGLRLDKTGAIAIAVFIFIEAIHVLVLVYSQTKNGKNPLIHPQSNWLLNLFAKSFPNLKKRLADFAMRQPDSEGKTFKKLFHIAFVFVFCFVLSLYFLSGIFVVNTGQLAIVERFGRPLQSEKPLTCGLHYHLPWPIEKARIIEAQKVRRMVVGTEVSPKSKVFLWTNAHFIREFNLLTGENIFVDTGIVLNYRISDPYDFLYTNSQAEKTLMEISQGVLLKHMAQAKFFDLVTTGRDVLEKLLLKNITLAIKPCSLGIELLSVNLRDIHPPTNVAGSFEEVVGASVDYETFINQAKGYESDLIPKARGQALVEVKKARSKGNRLIRKSKGESYRFLQNYKACLVNPTVMQTRIFLEAMEQSLAQKDKFILPDKGKAQAIELFMIETRPDSLLDLPKDDKSSYKKTPDLNFGPQDLDG